MQPIFRKVRRFCQITRSFSNMAKKHKKKSKAKERTDFQCKHDGIHHVFTLNNSRIYAGAGRDVAEEGPWDLGIACRNDVPDVLTKPPVRSVSGADKILPPELVNVPPTPILAITWPDRS